MHVVIAGSSGFLGRNLTEALRASGHTTTALVRRTPTADAESRWDPAAGQVDRQVIEDADVVVNVAGSPTIGNPHSRTWATNLRESRVTTTRTLAEAIAETGADGPRAMGQVMKAVQPKVAGRAEGGAVAAEVKRQLAN